MTTVINLDALVEEPAVRIVIDGKSHDMRPATVESFLANMKLIEDLGVNSNPVKEMEVGIKIILNAFPSLTEKQVRAWPLSHIEKLSMIARSGNAEVVSTDPAAVDKGETSGNA